MVEIADIKDEESFKIWLEQEDPPSEAVLALAHRAAMRVVPIWWARVDQADCVQKKGVTTLLVFRALLISGVSVFGLLPENIAETAAEAVEDVVLGTLDVDVYDVFYAVWAASHAAETATDFEKPYITYDAVSAINCSERAVKNSNIYSAEDIDINTNRFWAEIRADCALVTDVARLMSSPLWVDILVPIAQMWQSIKEQSLGNGSHFLRFWVDWYDAHLNGQFQNWEILRKVALIDPQDWDKGAAHVNRLIHQVVEGYPQ